MGNTLKVAVTDFPPLVIRSGAHYQGFEIELWEQIAHIIGVEFEYEVHPFKNIISLLTTKQVDVGLAGITQNEEREKVIDFSHATLDSGLIIATSKERNRLHLFKTLKNILREGHRTITAVLLFLIIFIFVSGNIIWFAEQGAHTFSASYFPGVFEAFWLTVVSMTTVGYGDIVPQTWIGKLIITLIIFSGAIMLSLFVAQCTAFLAVKKIKGEINNSHDLVGRHVATVDGSTSEAVLRKIGAHVVLVANIEEAYHKLKNDVVEAVVFDAPALLYYEKNDPSQSINLIGELFEKQQYGFALQQPSLLEEKINRAILNLKESGQYDALYKKWFGEDTVMEI